MKRSRVHSNCGPAELGLCTLLFGRSSQRGGAVSPNWLFWVAWTSRYFDKSTPRARDGQAALS
jgi:hypothetical protein